MDGGDASGRSSRRDRPVPSSSMKTSARVQGAANLSGTAFRSSQPFTLRWGSTTCSRRARTAGDQPSTVQNATGSQSWPSDTGALTRRSRALSCVIFELSRDRTKAEVTTLPFLLLPQKPHDEAIEAADTRLASALPASFDASCQGLMFCSGGLELALRTGLKCAALTRGSKVRSISTQPRCTARWSKDIRESRPLQVFSGPSGSAGKAYLMKGLPGKSGQESLTKGSAP
mmetsp:Transcript_72698/g.130922  ORF Transcript_72698/g.130922 Transcript_72698/m.130922 type:complete len:230 (-) Transcript_72698:1110-1799(-)